MQKTDKEVKKNIKLIKSSKNILLVLGLIYFLITILALVSYVSKMNNISTTDVTFMSVLSSIWWQILMIILFAVTYVMYNKKEFMGALLELVMGLSMLANIVVSVILMGANVFAILIELIYPFVLVCHSLLVIKKIKSR